MLYKDAFIIILFICSFVGIIFAVLNNEIIVIKEDNFNINYKNTNKEHYSLRYKNKQNEKENIINNINNIDNNNDPKENNIEIDKKKYEIPLAINIDNNYHLQAIVFLTSLMENIGPNTKYDIYIMIPLDFSKKYKERIDSLKDLYGSDKINIKYLIMKNTFSNAITSEHISTSAYYRLLLSSILPNVDKIIYSDCDVINFQDLSEMYNLKLEDDIYFRGFLDYFGHQEELLEFGISSDMYMNSGILLMNLKSLRKYGIERELIDLCENYFLEHHDQTAINVICSDNLEKLPIKYAIFNFESYDKLVEYNNEQNWKYRYSEKELKEGYYSPVMLHYAGFDKPWSKKNVKFEEYWWFYARKTEILEEILSKFEYTYNDIDIIIKKIPKDGGLLKNKYIFNK